MFKVPADQYINFFNRSNCNMLAICKAGFANNFFCNIMVRKCHSFRRQYHIFYLVNRELIQIIPDIGGGALASSALSKLETTRLMEPFLTFSKSFLEAVSNSLSKTPPTTDVSI